VCEPAPNPPALGREQGQGGGYLGHRPGCQRAAAAAAAAAGGLVVLLAPQAVHVGGEGEGGQAILGLRARAQGTGVFGETRGPVS